jgi:hypothetical protein
MLSKFLTFVQSAIWDQQFPLASFHALACSFNMASKICRKFLKAHGNSRLFFVSKIAPGNITHRTYSLIQNNPYIQFLNYSRPCRRFSSFNFQVRCSSTLSVRSKKVAFKAFLLDRTCNTECRGTVPTQVNITLRVGTKSGRGGLMDILII